jgi:hypothetical protein
MGKQVMTFEEFVKSRPKDVEPVDWTEQRKKFQFSVTDLYNKIDQWVFRNNEGNDPTLRRTTETIRISEPETVGNYEIPMLTLRIRDLIYKLIPVATVIVGGVGRVDLYGTKGKYLLVQKDWNKWEIVDNNNRFKHKPLTENNFKQALMDLA